MDLSGVWSSVGSVFVFVLLVIPGFIGIRKKIISQIHIDGLSAILVNFIWPAMVIDAMISAELTDEMFKTVLYSLGICFGGYLIATVIALVYVKIRKVHIDKRGIMKFGIILNNTGFIGMPLINVVFGPEGLIIAAMAEIACDTFIFTLGMLIMNDENGGIDKSAILNPGFISVFVGLFLLFSGVSIPSVITRPISIMGGATTAVAMFIIGAQLGEAKIKELFKERLCYEVAIIRLVVVPFVVFSILYLFFSTNAFANSILVIMFAMPSASCTAIFARQYNKDYHFATNCVMLTTVLSVVTIPLWLIAVSII